MEIKGLLRKLAPLTLATTLLNPLQSLAETSTQASLSHTNGTTDISAGALTHYNLLDLYFGFGFTKPKSQEGDFGLTLGLSRDMQLNRYQFTPYVRYTTDTNNSDSSESNVSNLSVGTTLGRNLNDSTTVGLDLRYVNFRDPTTNDQFLAGLFFRF